MSKKIGQLPTAESALVPECTLKFRGPRLSNLTIGTKQPYWQVWLDDFYLAPHRTKPNAPARLAGGFPTLHQQAPAPRVRLCQARLLGRPTAVPFAPFICTSHDPCKKPGYNMADGTYRDGPPKLAAPCCSLKAHPSSTLFSRYAAGLSS